MIGLQKLCHFWYVMFCQRMQMYETNGWKILLLICYICCTNHFNEWIQHSLKHLLNTDLWGLTLSLSIQKSYFDVSAYSLVGHQTLHNVSPYKKEKKRRTWQISCYLFLGNLRQHVKNEILFLISFLCWKKSKSWLLCVWKMKSVNSFENLKS